MHILGTLIVHERLLVVVRLLLADHAKPFWPQRCVPSRLAFGLRWHKAQPRRESRLTGSAFERTVWSFYFGTDDPTRGRASASEERL
jgi:hypothetical protein